MLLLSRMNWALLTSNDKQQTDEEDCLFADIQTCDIGKDQFVIIYK